MTRAEVTRLVAKLVAAFPQTVVEPATVAAYCEALGDLELEAATRAVDESIRSAKWFPRVSEIRERVVGAAQGKTRSGFEAWGDVRAEIARVGWYGVPVFFDRVTADVVRGIGWRTLCESENEMADRAHFAKAYDAAAARALEAAKVGRAGQLPELPAGGKVLALPARRELATQEAAQAAIRSVLEAVTDEEGGES